MANVNWLKIKNEYINTNISQRKLAEKYKISFPTLRDKAKKEKWTELRKEQRDKIVTKTSQKTADIIVEKEVNRIEKMLELSDDAQKLIKTALSQLDKQLVMGEVVDSEYIDVDRLKKLTAAIKDIKDIVREDKSANSSDVWGNIVKEFMKI